jgi:RNA polymerase sigma factor (sigma-70 family)
VEDGSPSAAVVPVVERRGSRTVPTPPDVRADLEEVFRGAYRRVVGVAARVLGSRDEAEDVAQEVFLRFGRSSVPAGEAVGWLCVAAAHTALNHLRTGRRRASREEAVGGERAIAPDVADAVVTRGERRRVRAALARLPRRQAVALVLRHSGLRASGVVAVGLFGATWIAGVVGSVGETLGNTDLAPVGDVSRMLLPTDGLWRGAMNAFQDPTLFAQLGSAAGQSPFVSESPLTGVYLGWAALWVALVLGLAALAFQRKDV